MFCAIGTICTIYKKREKHQWSRVTFSNVADLAFEQTTPKVAVFPVTFERTTRSRFLNCTNGTKSRNVSQI